MAEIVIKGGYAPKGVSKPEQVIIAMQVGNELGLPPMRALSAVAVINGKPGVMNEAALGILRSKGVLEPGTDLATDWDGEGDDLACIASLHRRGQPEPFASRFSIKMAKKAGLWGKPGPWSNYPQRMLMWRAVGFLTRDYFSDVLLGLPLEEELKDMPGSAPPSPDNKWAAIGSAERGPDPLLEAVVNGEVDPATGMEVLPPLPSGGGDEGESAAD